MPNRGGVGSATFNLVVEGSGFIAGTAVYWAGGMRTTTVINLPRLSVDIPGRDIADL